MGRLGWPGRGGRSGPARGEVAGAGVPRGRPPGDDEVLSPLSPLPPLPPRRRRPVDAYPPDDGWDAESWHESRDVDR
jgi:hypothetical protein